ncbi:MAG TPA: 5-deoxy-glucuronate isomerase [Desertimonas sp.]|nr:5-deoxy-glucuronate isomerase [Desertimonas sp.]
MSGLRQSDDSQPVAQLTQTHRHPWHLGPVAEVTPETAGWAYCGLRILSIAPGGAYELVTGGSEMAVLPLSGGPLTVDVEGQRLELDGRATVFSAVTDWAYLPIDAEVRLSSATGAELALPAARASRRFDAAHVAADDVAVEVRGAGPATRQVTNFMSPEAFDGADKLMCVELLTPDGNWSSYPPHRHDDSPECPVNNEEIYYFRIGTAGTTDYAPGGFALHRTYTPAGDVDATVTVGDGDMFLVKRGYHGPCVAAPGYPLYYLNVLAGPDGQRSMAFCDDPAHHWIRDSWEHMAVDPRVPMSGASSRE